MPTPDEVFDKGTRRYKEGRYEDAERQFRKLLQLIPETEGRGYGRAAYSLGITLMKLDRIDEAREALEAALAADPSLTRAQQRLDEIDALATDLPAPFNPGGIVGVASAVQQRYTSDAMIRGQGTVVLSFRLQILDEASDEYLLHEVRMEGSRIVGRILDGDVIELPANWRPGNAVKSVHNRSTGEIVRADNATKIVQWVILAVALVLILGFIVFVNVKIFSGR